MRTWFKTHRKRIAEAEKRVHDWLNPDPIRVNAEQLLRLRLVWQDAISNVPYYSNLVISKKAPMIIESLEQFSQEVPILTKSILREHADQFVRISRNYDKIATTGGSTGEPLKVGHWHEEAFENAVNMNVGRLANGMDLKSDKLFNVWSQGYLLEGGFKANITQNKMRIHDYLLGYHTFNVAYLDKYNKDICLNKMLKFRPNVLRGFTNGLFHLSIDSDKFKTKIQELGLKMLIGGSEKMPSEAARKSTEAFFNAPLFMEYAASETGPLAAEHTGTDKYRVFWWNKLLETENTNNNDTLSKVLLVTDLRNRYLPIVRYRIGDEIVGETKINGNQVVQFNDIVGRTADVVDLGEGEMIHPNIIYWCVCQEPSVHNYQLILEHDNITLLFVGKENKIVEKRVRNKLNNLSKKLSQCNIVFVDDLQTTLAGKRRWVIDKRRKENLEID